MFDCINLFSQPLEKQHKQTIHVWNQKQPYNPQ